ncbi:MAG: hypothetical protein ABSF70_14355 [Terracidiphilus sp.]|jgi:hypothetical protein
MNEPLRPSTLGEILDRTAQLYRSRFLVFLGISIVPTGVVLALAFVVALVVAWWSWAGASSVSSETGYVLVVVFSTAVTLVALPVLLVAASLSSAAINHAVSRVYLGETATIRDAYKSVWRRGWRYVGLYLLRALFIWLLPLAAWILVVVLGAVLAAEAKKAGMGDAASVLLGLLAVLAIIALLGYMLWIALRLALAFPACVAEQIGAWSSVKRSSLLSTGTKGRIFLLYLLGMALGWILSIGITIPLTIILALLPGMNNPQHAQTMGMAMLFVIYGATFLVQAFIQPVYGIALVLFYYDQRIRIEGFDIEWMMLKAGLTPSPAPMAIETPEAKQEPTPWLPVVPLLTPPPEPKPESPQSGVDE